MLFSAQLSKFKACLVINILLSFLLLFLLEADGNGSCERRAGSEWKLNVDCPLATHLFTKSWQNSGDSWLGNENSRESWRWSIWVPILLTSYQPIIPAAQCCWITMFSFNHGKCTIPCQDLTYLCLPHLPKTKYHLSNGSDVQNIN